MLNSFNISWQLSIDEHKSKQWNIYWRFIATRQGYAPRRRLFPGWWTSKNAAPGLTMLLLLLALDTKFSQFLWRAARLGARQSIKRVFPNIGTGCMFYDHNHTLDHCYGQSYGQYGHCWWPVCLICPAPPPPPPGWPPAARRGPGAGCRGCRGHPCRSTCTPATSTLLTSM